MKEKEYALVLQGGGTKGAYQVGVWKALKELGINVKAISGASIGSLNGALILQDNINQMIDLYENIEIKDIMEISEKIDSRKNLFNISKQFSPLILIIPIPPIPGAVEIAAIVLILIPLSLKIT